MCGNIASQGNLKVFRVECEGHQKWKAKCAQTCVKLPQRADIYRLIQCKTFIVNACVDHIDFHNELDPVLDTQTGHERTTGPQYAPSIGMHHH